MKPKKVASPTFRSPKPVVKSEVRYQFKNYSDKPVFPHANNQTIAILLLFVVVTALWLGYLGYIGSLGGGMVTKQTAPLEKSSVTKVEYFHHTPQLNCWAPESQGGPRGCH